ncbi:UTP--glucose-1-phosphate uridylyltransferase GalU [Candidatus Coxiella mudrowiae]|uniref:UTP--glucose-1-phosphate uridylyltransferase n=1 Tax=Candidatus Coxiella mudrowiae TaxID=2054173 RepID=A0ABN4HR66_9COXI|nr:UTP--glucose-1-phosphate uridylyltransferase GalU [Candidatus Coxiella mudrowiae]AKQ33736.1 UTP--glucose-1-phosphate uridylyltransferase [Candidatus Coxiella mudrowiae]
MKKITTAVFPVAGLGTRFLPVTKAGPKEMLPIVDKPIIQYAVEEAIRAGITHLVFVTSSSKRAIEDYFDSNYELEMRLQSERKFNALKLVQNILPKEASISYVRQSHPLGLGDAVLSARHVVGDQHFAVLLPDDIIDCGEKSCLQLMTNIYEKYDANVIAVEHVEAEEVDKYGIVSVREDQGVKRITGMIEKPPIRRAPSDLAVTGRYILSPGIFKYLDMIEHGIGGEIQLTDAIVKLIQEELVIAYPFEGRRYDCGSRLGFLQATIAYALERNEFKEPLRAYLLELLTLEYV